MKRSFSDMNKGSVLTKCLPDLSALQQAYIQGEEAFIKSLSATLELAQRDWLQNSYSGIDPITTGMAFNMLLKQTFSLRKKKKILMRKISKKRIICFGNFPYS